jgi:membrane protein implicated in regulation of membrane protease activity
MIFGIPYPVLWLAVAVILVVIEASSLNLLTIWFALGALAAMVASLFGIPLYFQAVVFIVTSAILLYFTKPIVKNFLSVRKERTNADKVIGEKGIVVERIDPISGTGQVKVRGQIWTARSADDLVIEENETVEIQEISGVKLFVKKCLEVTINK